MAGNSDGPAPRFGSCYFLLEPAVNARATFCYGDSHTAPTSWATQESLEVVLSELMLESFTRDSAIGIHPIRPPALVERIHTVLDGGGVENCWCFPPARNLDHYIEAQIHGAIQLGRDASALVACRSFRNHGEIGRQLELLASRYGLQLHWHEGSSLEVDRVPSDFRGPLMPGLARRIAGGGSLLTPPMIGDAARRAAEASEEEFAGFGGNDTKQVLQNLKLLWHCLPRYGSAIDTCAGSGPRP